MNSSSVPAQTSQSNNPSTSASAAVASSSPEKKLPSSSSSSSYYTNNYHDSQMARSTAKILSNIGFTSASKSTIYILASMMRKYFESLSRNASTVANNAGRTIINFSDVAMSFEKMGVNVTELHDYIREVDSFGHSKVPLFPVAEPCEQLTVDVATQPVESVERKEDELLADELHSPLEKYVKPQPQRLFPDFFAQPATNLGFLVRAAPVPIPVIDSQVNEEQEPNNDPDISNLVNIVPEKSKSKRKKKDKVKKKRKHRGRSRSTEKQKERHYQEEPPAEMNLEAESSSTTNFTDVAVSSENVASKEIENVTELCDFIQETDDNFDDAMAPLFSATYLDDQSSVTTQERNEDSLLTELQPSFEANALSQSLYLTPERFDHSTIDLSESPSVIAPQLEEEKYDSFTDPESLNVSPEKSKSKHKKKDKEKKKRKRRDRSHSKESRKERRTETSAEDAYQEGSCMLYTDDGQQPSTSSESAPKLSSGLKLKIKFGTNSSVSSSSIIAVESNNYDGPSAPSASAITASTRITSTTFSMSSGSSEGSIEMARSILEDSIIFDKDNKLPASSDDVDQPVVVIEPPAKRKKLSTGEVLRKTTDNVAAKVAAAKVNNNTSSNGKRTKSVVGSVLTTHLASSKDNSFSTPQRTTSSMLTCKDDETVEKSTTKSKPKSSNAKKKLLLSEKSAKAELISTARTVMSVEPSEKGLIRNSATEGTSDTLGNSIDDVDQPVVVIEPPAKRKKLSTGEVLRKTTDNVAAKVAAAKVNNNASSNGKRAKSVVGSALTTHLAATKDNSFSTPQRTTSSMSAYKESGAAAKSSSKSKSKSGSSKKKALTAAKCESISPKITAASVVDNDTVNNNGGVRPPSAAATDEAMEDEDNVWICPECSVAYVDGAADMVGCDGCDRWFHWHCVGLLISPPENKEWFCHACQKRRKKSSSSAGGYAATPTARPPSATHAKKK